MSIYKIAKSIARTTGEDIKEVLDKFARNRKKLRRMEDRVRVEGYKKRAEFHSPQSLDRHKRAFKAQSRTRT